MKSERPTMPPTAADAKAEDFGRRLADLEKGQRRTHSGLLRALAIAWAETQPEGQK